MDNKVCSGAKNIAEAITKQSINSYALPKETLVIGEVSASTFPNARRTKFDNL